MTEIVSRGARATADLYDEYGERLQSCDLQLRQYGSIRAFFGAMTTVKCFDDNVLLNSVLTDEDEPVESSWSMAADPSTAR